MPTKRSLAFAASTAYLPTMPMQLRCAVLFALGLMLSCCAAAPKSLGGMPRNVPPRPGTPEYVEYQKQIEAERTRDKSKDAKPANAPTIDVPR